MSTLTEDASLPIVSQSCVSSTREYMRAYNKSRKDDEYYTLMKRLHNKLSYHRRTSGLTDANPDYQAYRLLYPEFLNIREALNNIRIIMDHNMSYTDLSTKLHELIDELLVKA